MISALYIVLSAIIIGQLSMNVIKVRRQYKISIGDGSNHALQLAICAQTNAVEYLPIGMLLLISLEFNAANNLIIHALGITLLVGRIMHAKAMLADNLKRRVIGMQITFYTLLAMAVMNMGYLPYGKLIQF